MLPGMHVVLGMQVVLDMQVLPGMNFVRLIMHTSPPVMAKVNQNGEDESDGLIQTISSIFFFPIRTCGKLRGSASGPYWRQILKRDVAFVPVVL